MSQIGEERNKYIDEKRPFLVILIFLDSYRLLQTSKRERVQTCSQLRFVLIADVMAGEWRFILSGNPSRAQIANAYLAEMNRSFCRISSVRVEDNMGTSHLVSV